MIRVENLGKKYLLKHRQATERYRTLRDVLAGGLKSGFRLLNRDNAGDGSSTEEFWALKDVSFDVKEGEVIGIIGRNGAGKSTLLKVLSRITEPTVGRVTLNGRVASLLEVGTGFHPELTGRENVYLNGSILGMTRREIARKFDEIVGFAEVEKFLDTPVKRYSSGMYVRLAFAVAAHLEPEILVVDEVLAVGDAAFQKKCLGKMNEAAKGGRTVLFVSHNMPVVKSLCQRAVLLKDGSVIHDGDVIEAVQNYLTNPEDFQGEWVDERADDPHQAVRLLAVRLLHNGRPASAPIPASDPMTIEIEYHVRRPTACQIAFRLNQQDGETVFTTADGDVRHEVCRERKPGWYRATTQLPPNLLTAGRYHLLVAANRPVEVSHDLIERVLSFEVDLTGSLRQLDGRLGSISPLLSWTESQTRVAERHNAATP
ncbi:MAG: ABC transporter ATP-binding protein [Planctomycetes bacterium]|nr:ABC transporter ATP-binding protein [Planctomycetota bacterium]